MAPRDDDARERPARDSATDDASSRAPTEDDGGFRVYRRRPRDFDADVDVDADVDAIAIDHTLARASPPRTLRDAPSMSRALRGSARASNARRVDASEASGRRVGDRNDRHRARARSPACASRLGRRAARAAGEDADADVRSIARRLEFMVEMRCEKCAIATRRAVWALGGTRAVDVSVSANTATVVTSDAASTVRAAIEGAGMRCRLIGSGAVDGEVFGAGLAAALGTDARTLRQSVAAVAEFKGEAYGHGDVVGVVRLVQVNAETILGEATLGGLAPGTEHEATIRTYGDTRRGIESAGEVYDVETATAEGGRRVGEIAVVVSDARGEITLPATILSDGLKTWDVIGRSVAVRNTETNASVVAVLARSAGVGENHKKLCQCDGTVIWEADEDFLPVAAKPSRGTSGPLFERGMQTVRRGE